MWADRKVEDRDLESVAFIRKFRAQFLSRGMRKIAIGTNGELTYIHEQLCVENTFKGP